MNTKFDTAKDRSMFFEKLAYSKSKIELLTNQDKLEQKELLVAVENLLDVVTMDKEKFKNEDLQLARNKTIKAARKLFGIHWTKIKDLN